MASEALRDGVRTDYHTFMHFPNEIREALTGLGLDVKVLEEEDDLRILDSYSVQQGKIPEQRGQVALKSGQLQRTAATSLRLSDWSIGAAQQIKGTVEDMDKTRFHIDDNTSVLLQYNQEKEMVDYWRTRMVPWARSMEFVVINSSVAGVYSDSFYRQYELIMDGIIDFKTEEKEEKIVNSVRIRAMRGKKFDSRWHHLELQDSGEVTLTD